MHLAPDLSARTIETLLAPYVETLSSKLIEQLSQYLALLLHWNARTNLTAIRSPEEMVRRHFGESLFAAQVLGEACSLLDFGSGAGFPGLPIALYHPNMAVTLAESQQKKSSFLREVVRELKVPIEVWPHRVAEMPLTRNFECVTLRAVDRMRPALMEASQRSAREVMVLTTLPHRVPDGVLPGFHEHSCDPIPNSAGRIVQRLIRG